MRQVLLHRLDPGRHIRAQRRKPFRLLPLARSLANHQLIDRLHRLILVAVDEHLTALQVLDHRIRHGPLVVVGQRRLAVHSVGAHARVERAQHDGQRADVVRRHLFGEHLRQT